MFFVCGGEPLKTAFIRVPNYDNFYENDMVAD